MDQDQSLVDSHGCGPTTSTATDITLLTYRVRGHLKRDEDFTQLQSTGLSLWQAIQEDRRPA